MSTFDHFIDTSMTDTLWVSAARRIYSRKLFEADWKLVYEFEDNVIAIDHTGEIIKKASPVILVLLASGKVFYSIDKGNSWQLFETDQPVTSIAAIKRYYDSEDTEDTEEKNLGDMQSVFLLSNNRIRCYAISENLNFVFKGDIAPVAASSIHGFRDELLFISSNSRDTPIIYTYREGQGIKKNAVSCPLRKVRGLVNFNNSPALLLNWGKVVMLRFPETSILYPYKDGSKCDFPYPNRIDDMMCMDTIPYTLLDTGEMYVGHPDLGWEKVRMPWDENGTDASQRDELSEMYENGQRLLVSIIAHDIGLGSLVP
ncbi:hypothetical protein [Succinimonas amylolytica]|uniref:hypothetical protein n=1 Tax=Succinimonas amylolytica TaxID=83769 RepID=UPI0003793D73|nr:hypothetical protein [Succinimonas amylolytica]